MPPAQRAGSRPGPIRFHTLQSAGGPQACFTGLSPAGLCSLFVFTLRRLGLAEGLLDVNFLQHLEPDGQRELDLFRSSVTVQPGAC
ncbi:uncharacterized protein LOC144333723 isoform X2 [Macaca mulatta]